MLTVLMFVCELSHFRLPQRHRNAIDTDFDARSETLGLKIVLRAKLPGAFGDYRRVRIVSLSATVEGCDYVLSSWRLSMSICFWPIEIPVTCFLRGLS